MSLEKFVKRATTFSETADTQRGELAAIYGEILQDMEVAFAKATALSTTWSPTVRGVNELRQLVQIADGGFAAVARAIIAEAQAAAEAEAAPAEAGVDAPVVPEA